MTVSKSILFITTNSLATNPRLVKELRTCARLGHRVTVCSFSFDNWSKPINDKILYDLKDKVNFITIPGDRTSLGLWVFASLVNFFSKRLLPLFPGNLRLLSFAIFKRSIILEVVLRRGKQKYDWVIAHNPGSFVVAHSYVQYTSKLGIDIEDYHPGETNDPLVVRKLEQIMKTVLPAANVVTAASPKILDASLALPNNCKSLKHAVINNVFSKIQQPGFRKIPMDSLSLVWFSQTVGLDRGIQDVIHAMNSIEIFSIHLTIIGSCNSNVKSKFSMMLNTTLHTIHFKPPMEENKLIIECSSHHIGLALETGTPYNRQLCLTNKLFTYLLAGNAVVASGTASQAHFFQEESGIGEIYPIGDWRRLALILKSYFSSPVELAKARANAYELARKKYNWDEEEKKLISLYCLERNSETPAFSSLHIDQSN